MTDILNVEAKLKELIKKSEEDSEVAESIIDACNQVNKSWSGSSMVRHARLFYIDLKSPPTDRRFNIEWGTIYGIPKGWKEYEDDRIIEEIERISGQSLEKLRKDAEHIEASFNEYKKEAVIALAEDGYAELGKIEQFSITTATDHFNNIFPTKYMTRDSAAITEGHYIVPHLYYKALAMLISNSGKDMKDFIYEIKKITAKKIIRNSDEGTSGHYVEISTILKLRDLSNESFDFSRLVQLCKELNDNYSLKNYLACIMLLRAIIDHVPPLFGQKNFSEVIAHHGQRSFKDIVKPLDETCKKIADSYLHGQIRKKELLPTQTQVSFQPNLDYLLNEIVRKFSE